MQNLLLCVICHFCQQTNNKNILVTDEQKYAHVYILTSFFLGLKSRSPYWGVTMPFPNPGLPLAPVTPCSGFRPLTLPQNVPDAVAAVGDELLVTPDTGVISNSSPSVT